MPYYFTETYQVVYLFNKKLCCAYFDSFSEESAEEMLHQSIEKVWIKEAKEDEHYTILMTMLVEHTLKLYTVVYKKYEEDLQRIHNFHASSVQLAVAHVNHLHVMNAQNFPTIISALRSQIFKP